MRLIDADKLIDFLDVGHLCHPNELRFSELDVVNMLNHAPTAYDVDAVVEQLEKLKSLVPVNRILDDIINDKPKELGMLIAYEKAIKIVKGGGVDGD